MTVGFFVLIFFNIIYGQRLVPEYEVAIAGVHSIASPGSVNITTTFGKLFTAIPQIMIGWSQVDMDGGINKYSTTIAEITINYFIITFTTPAAAFFLTGISQTKPTDTSYEYDFSLGMVTSSQVEVRIDIVGGCEINYFSYNLVYGLPSIIITGRVQLNTYGPIQLFGDSRTKVTQIGLTELYGTNRIRLDIVVGINTATASTWSNTTFYYYNFHYLNYMPCPIYCTTCYAPVPNCDGCLASTYRIGSTCTTCVGQMFIQTDQINCQQCKSYCDNCFGEPYSCIACKASTLRLGAPDCKSCPLGLFLELFIDDCQSCRAYCNGCSGSPTACVQCTSGTLRINPPQCLTCPPQYHVVSNTLICQPCQPYCNNCLSFSSSCVACSSASLRLNAPDCLQCPQNMYLSGDTCTLCNNNCETCDQNGCLTCLNQSAYINVLNQCVNCPSHCLSCDIDKCYSCAGNCVVCNLQICQKCIDSNYYLSETDCIRCPDNCQTCNQQTCLTCIGPRIIQNNNCQCQKPCLTCNSNECLTCISSDYQILHGTCQYCPSRCFACDSQGNCLTRPQNCRSGSVIPDEVKCTQCISNYYLKDNICNKCASICLECLDQPLNCSICRFNQTRFQECRTCESQIGYYSDYQNNVCYTICGDAVVADNEECDDGNYLSQDGCSNCKIDPGYYCTDIGCFTIIYPKPSLNQNMNHDTPYNSTKVFSLIYNVPISTTILDTQIVLQPTINFTSEVKPINNQSFEILLRLQEQSLNGVIQLNFKDVMQITSLEGYSQQIVAIKCDISNFLMITVTEQDMSNSTNTITNILFIILIILISLGVIFGGVEVFWNLLDLLQTISYLKYINTVKPQYLYDFFSLFGFLQPQNMPLNQLFNTQAFVQNQIDINQFIQAPLLMSNDGYTQSTIINIVPIINVFFLGTLTYYISYGVFYIARSIPINYQLAFINKAKASIFLYNFKYKIIRMCDSIQKQWFYTGLIRTLMSSSYDICFAIALGISGIQILSFNLIKEIDSAMTIFLLFSYLVIIQIISIIAGLERQTLLQNQNKVGAVFEGLRFNVFAKHYNILLMYKKLLFMIFLVLLYYQPIFQITSIIFIQIAQITILLLLKPVKQRQESQKQIICEILILCTEFQLLMLVIGDSLQIISNEQRNIYAWICIFAMVLIIITQLCLDSYLQYKRMHKQYRLVRKISNCICCKSEITQKPINLSQNFII